MVQNSLLFHNCLSDSEGTKVSQYKRNNGVPEGLYFGQKRFIILKFLIKNIKC